MSTELKYLLDTNILLEALWGKEPAASLVFKWIKNKQLILSPIVVGEIYAKASKEEKQKLELLISKFGVLPLDALIAKTAGEYRQKFLKKKKKVFLLDCFLAATAKIYNLTLVTRNISDYPMKDIRIFDPQ